MRTRHNCWIWIGLLVALLVAAPSGRAQKCFGYIPTPKEELMGIPLAPTPFSGAELPESVDLSSQMPPPGVQGNQSSCVGWSIAYALKSHQEKIEQNWSLTDSSGRPDPAHVFSPAFVYNQLNQGRDGGCIIKDALNLLSQQGAALLAEMPYNDRDYTTRPDDATATRARRYRIDYYRQVNVSDIKEVKAQLNAGFPVVFGAMVDDGFYNAHAGYVWSRNDGGTKGGHAMLLVGYDNRKHAFKLINSWGRDWGDRGYGWIDYEHFPRVAREGFVAKDCINGPPPTIRADNPFGPPPPPPPPVVAQRPAFRITSVTHGIQDRNGVMWMKLEGDLMVPPGAARQDQVVIHFYFDAGGGRKGITVRGSSPQFSDVGGFAATGTQVYPVPPEGLAARWCALIPYSALVLMPGSWVNDYYGRPVYQPRPNYLLAEPVLFLDGFGVATGGLVPFYVTQ